MTSWEDVINQVVIPGEGAAILNAQAQWSRTIGAATNAKMTLDGGIVGLQAWHGAAGDAYRKRISDIARALDDLIQTNSPIVGQLDTAGHHMNDAISAIPIPGEMVPAVTKAKADFASRLHVQNFPNGAINDAITGYVNSNWNVAALMEANGPHWFNNFMTGVRDWFSHGDNTAVAAYDRLNEQYQTVAAGLPGTSAPSTLGVGPMTPTTNLPGPGFGNPGGMPQLGTGGIPAATGLDPLGGVGALDPLGLVDPPALTEWDGTDPPGSGLAGVGGPGGLSGVGGLGSGLGAPSLAGAGLTALGPGGSLPAGASKGLGPITSPFGGAGMPGMPGMGGGIAGRGGAGTSAGKANGLLGGTGGGGRPSAGDEHATWLQEDDDVWGTDSGAAPPLLR